MLDSLIKELKDNKEKIETSYQSCEHCARVKKEAELAQKSAEEIIKVICDYVNDLSGIPKFFGKLKPCDGAAYFGSLVVWRPDEYLAHFGGGVFEGDSSDGGPRMWYWHQPKERNSPGSPDHPHNWADTPIDALKAFLEDLETKYGAPNVTRND